VTQTVSFSSQNIVEARRKHSPCTCLQAVFVIDAQVAFNSILYSHRTFILETRYQLRAAFWFYRHTFIIRFTAGGPNERGALHPRTVLSIFAILIAGYCQQAVDQDRKARTHMYPMACLNSVSVFGYGQIL